MKHCEPGLTRIVRAREGGELPGRLVRLLGQEDRRVGAGANTERWYVVLVEDSGMWRPAAEPREESIP